jgi:3-hydroxybutyryl-CoA dehydrogenase
MRIAVLATGWAKKELLSKAISSTVELTFLDSLGDMILSRNADIFFDLDFVFDKERINKLGQLLPKPVFVNSVIHTLEEIGSPFIRINAWPTFLKRDICEVVAGDNQHQLIAEIFEKLDWRYQLVPDIIGMISCRILATVINEAYHTLDDEVSTKEEIDIAMKLGTSYPLGPFEWSEKIGLKEIYDLLLHLSKKENIYIVAKGLERQINP